MKKSRLYIKPISIFLLFSMVFELGFPVLSYALTTGPTTPELSSFEPLETSKMVDLFSGDFVYNIPLIDVDGYPVNLSYHSGITMDQEASWVGLGWNVNVGSINRNMRGIPDDFNGNDLIVKNMNIKTNKTYGINMGGGYELVGLGGMNSSQGIRYNNYTGVGFEYSMSVSIAAGGGGKGSLNASLGLRSSEDGLDVSPSISYNGMLKRVGGGFGLGISSSYNSRTGIKYLNLSPKSNSKLGSFISYKANIEFAKPSYTPQVTMPMRNTAVSIAFKPGIVGFWFSATSNYEGYYSENKLEKNEVIVPAFGYLHSEKYSRSNKIGQFDFNREKDGNFNDHTTNLPLTSFTYDTYSVTGQGNSGVYRAHRNDVGHVYDPASSSSGDSYNLGVELETMGLSSKLGGDFGVIDVRSNSGEWEENNSARFYTKFHSSVIGSADVNAAQYEIFDFREASEINSDPDAFMYNSYGGENAARFQLVDEGDVAHLQKKLEVSDGSVLIAPGTNYRKRRAKRNNVFSYLTRKDYSNFAVYNDNSIYNEGNQRLNDHLAEISILKPDGSRYIYGIPAYNTKHKEVSFNSSERGVDAFGNTTYVVGEDNTIGNKLGKDNYFSSTEIPPYAYAYLLTAVLSPDYVDISSNGPTPDDLGTYTFFKYDKVNKFDDDIPFGWRTPYNCGTATPNENLKSITSDDNSNYLYGEKEVYLLKEIVSKNYTAYFERENRRDGHGTFENSKPLSTDFGASSQLLKRIVLKSNTGQTEIKTVNFVYDYLLCTGIPNNDGGFVLSDYEKENQLGKLTLKSVYFTYGNSSKAKLSPYNFNYDYVNPPYNSQSVDRWGNYKTNDPSLPNSDFPYTTQNRTIQNANSAAWSLSSINLPSGGEIKLTYEADDYAYVQNKIAGEMFTLEGCAAVNDISAKIPSLFTVAPGNSSDFMFFKLKSPILNSGSVTSDEVKFIEDYGKDLENLYFKVLVKINGAANKEYVNGYIPRVDRENSNSINFKLRLVQPSSGNYEYGAIELIKKYDIGIGTSVNPIVKAALQFARIHTPRESFALGDPNDEGVLSVFLKFLNAQMWKQVIDALSGPDKVLYDKGLGYSFEPSKSWIRLNSPDRSKIGGGVRVAKIEMDNKWADMGSLGSSEVYGQEFIYKVKEEGRTEPISSGVASYEPFVGNDENSWRQPVYSHEENMLAPDNDFYAEEPFGESFFPSPDVGYSQIIMRNIHRTNVKRHATGFTINEFYTAKDFPTITSRTDLYPVRKKTPFLLKLFGFYTKDHMNATQGYSIVTNDMHGKQKAVWVYSEEAGSTDMPDRSKLISGMEYKYSSSGNRLNNSVKTIDEKGIVSDAELLGVETDVVADMREESTITSNLGIRVNNHFDVVIVPIFAPFVWPSASVESTKFRSSVITKIINKHGLLNEVIAYDLGSKITTRNLAFDRNTGEVLLTEIINEFEDPHYSFTYPAYWAYEGMGPTARNIDAFVSCTVNNLGVLTTIGTQAMENKYFLIPGDEVKVENGVNSNLRYWIVKDDNGDLLILQKNGTPDFALVGHDLKIRVLRSGNRNLQSTPVGSVVTQKNPLNTDHSLTFDSVLNASALVFSDDWKTICNCDFVTSSSPNTYVTGLKGNWRAKKSYTYLTHRNTTIKNDNKNLRADGAFKLFSPFWAYNGTGTSYTFEPWNEPSNLSNPMPDWTWSSEVSLFSPYGFELENKDALDRFSSAQYNFNNKIPTAVAKNAKYKEIGFESFEDLPCMESHFTFNNSMTEINSTLDRISTKKHSGKYSLRINPGSSVIMTKPIIDCDANSTPGED